MHLSSMESKLLSYLEMSWTKFFFMCKWIDLEEIDGMVECDIANKPCLTMEQGMV